MRISTFKAQFSIMSSDDQKKAVAAMEKEEKEWSGKHLVGIPEHQHEQMREEFSKLVKWCKQNQKL